MMSGVWVGAARIPNSFSAGASAKAGMDSNGTPLTDSGAVPNSLLYPATRTLSFPAAALSHITNDPAIEGIITNFSSGLLWQANFRKGASLTLRKPIDYAGGDVTFRIFFQTTTPTAGKVQFFIRPRSLNSGDGLFDVASISATPVNVVGSSGFGTMYEQPIVIPGSSLTKGWWYTVIQRQGSDETYKDNVIVFGVAFEYSVPLF